MSPHRPFPFRLYLHGFRVYLPVWGLLGLVIFVVQTVLAAMLHDREDLRIFLQAIERLPGFVKALLGGDDLMAGNVLSVVAIGYQHPLVLLCLTIGATTIPTGMLTAEVDRGTMELLLSRPVSRGRLYARAILSTCLGQIALVATIFCGTSIWTRVFDYGRPIPLVPFAKVAANLLLLNYAVTGLAVLASAWFDERPRALAAVVGYLVVAYLLFFSAAMWPRLNFVKPWTPFSYYVPNAILKSGAIPSGDAIVLALAGTLSLALGWFVWRNKDLPAA